jgi:hypothetical protein
MEFIKDNAYEFMIYSMLLTFSRQMRYPIESKIGVLSLITLVEHFPSPLSIPVFHRMAVENILSYLTKKLKFQNKKLIDKEEYGYSEDDEEDDDYK